MKKCKNPKYHRPIQPKRLDLCPQVYAEYCTLGCKGEHERDQKQSNLCAEHKPSAELTATYFNFLLVRDLTDDELLSPFYSEFACQTCGSELAGDRYYCTATIGESPDGLVEKFEICADCYEYFFT